MSPFLHHDRSIPGALTRRALALAAVAVVSATIAAAAETALAPSTILANPPAYQGKTVSVAGKVAQIQTASTLRGKFTFYQLCDGRCVNVIDATNPSYRDGQSETASGTFQTEFKGPKRTFKNVIVVK